jgi:hypothetical protein
MTGSGWWTHRPIAPCRVLLRLCPYGPRLCDLGHHKPALLACRQRSRALLRLASRLSGARFEGLGTAEVRHELGVGYVRHLSGEQRVQAQEWLAEQDASFKDATIEAKSRETRQFILGIIVGALGALGTIIAAWLVIKVWLR